MLVLTRLEGQSVIIGDKNIIVTVLGSRNGQVKLGFDAPEDITIHREEVYERIQKQEEQQKIREVIEAIE
jgi:carbon storage regulator